MLELIALICALLLIGWIPTEASKVINGWVNKRFKGDHAAFLKAYRKQLTFLVWAGPVFFVLMGGIALVAFSDGGDTLNGVIKLVSAVAWAIDGWVAHLWRGKLDAAIASGSIPSAPKPAT